MISKLFAGIEPSSDATILDPGAGEGAFIEGLIRWFGSRELALPRITGVESDPNHVRTLRARFSAHPEVSVLHADFLASELPRFDFVVGNPPYVSIAGLSMEERDLYRQRYATARGRFDLYILFFERALGLLSPGGRLVFITPEKFLYVESGRALRKMLTGFAIDELHFFDEDTFAGFVTYPLVTSLRAAAASDSLSVVTRDGTGTRIAWRPTEDSWLGLLNGSVAASGVTLEDVCKRISCGVATGADGVFVLRNSDIPPDLRPFAHPTLAGREVAGSHLPAISRSFLLPYSENGELLALEELGAFRDYLEQSAIREKLLARTCVQRKPWYAFHETPPLRDILNPKILCKDIAASPTFVLDVDGAIVPRHSLYYIVPRNPDHLIPLFQFLVSPAAREWLVRHSQRASGGFIRMQSHVLKRLPLPAEFALHAAETQTSFEMTLRSA
jgi:hypothetical protein